MMHLSLVKAQLMPLCLPRFKVAMSLHNHPEYLEESPAPAPNVKTIHDSPKF